jgi:hypothetical protein
MQRFSINRRPRTRCHVRAIENQEHVPSPVPTARQAAAPAHQYRELVERRHGRGLLGRRRVERRARVDAHDGAPAPPVVQLRAADVSARTHDPFAPRHTHTHTQITQT